MNYNEFFRQSKKHGYTELRRIRRTRIQSQNRIWNWCAQNCLDQSSQKSKPPLIFLHGSTHADQREEFVRYLTELQWIHHPHEQSWKFSVVITTNYDQFESEITTPTKSDSNDNITRFVGVAAPFHARANTSNDRKSWRRNQIRKIHING